MTPRIPPAEPVAEPDDRRRRSPLPRGRGRRSGSGRGGRSATARSRRSSRCSPTTRSTPRFFLTRQSLLFILLRQAAPIAIVAVGMAIVIGTAGIDLSVGSVMAIAGQVGATLVLDGHPFLLAIIAALSVSALCGVFNGTLVARFGVQPIIATLILFIAGRGIAQLITDGELQPLANPAFQWIGLARPCRRAGAGDHRRRRGRGRLAGHEAHRLRPAGARRRRQRDRVPARGAARRRASSCWRTSSPRLSPVWSV